MFIPYIEEDTTKDHKNEEYEVMRDEEKKKYVEDNFMILTTVPDKIFGVKVTEYLDKSTGEIISAKDARDLFCLKSIYYSTMLNRHKKLESLKEGPRDFANFILKFRNNSCGFKVSFETLIDWYANLKDKRNQHVKRYIKPLVDAEILYVVEGIPFLHEDFMINSGKQSKTMVKGDVFSARCLYDNMIASSGKRVDGMINSFNT